MHGYTYVPFMHRQSQPKELQGPTSWFEMHKLLFVQSPQQGHKNKQKSILTGQEMPQYACYNWKV
jgi:hypothetical protein